MEYLRAAVQTALGAAGMLDARWDDDDLPDNPVEIAALECEIEA